MVSSTCCAPSEAGSRRYSRACPPYSFTYSDRRHHFSSHDNRAMMMNDRDREDTDQPRKRIAVACGRCRKRKIRCSGDPGNGGPCSNCKNAGYEPCLFLRVSSTERHFKDSEYPYSLEAARLAHQGAGAVSPLASIPQYAHDVGAADGLTPYRQSPYPYSNGSTRYSYSTSAMPAWSSTYTDESTSNGDYGGYYTYPVMSQEPSSIVPGYSQYNTRRPVYADPEAAASAYSYANITHRPAVSSDSQTFGMSNMAASLPRASDIHRTLTSPTSYRTDALPAQYATTNSKTSSAVVTTLPDIAYSTLQPAFETPYSTTSALTASPISHRPSSHADGVIYGTSSGATATDHQLYTSGDQGVNSHVRSAEDYIYGDNATNSTTTNNNNNKIVGGGSRRESSHHNNLSSAGVNARPVLANGHVYVPESHSTHPTPHPYIISSSTSSTVTSHSHSRSGAAGDSATTSGGRGSGSGSSGNNGSSSSHHHRSSESQRRSAGTHRGG